MQPPAADCAANISVKTKLRTIVTVSTANNYPAHRGNNPMPTPVSRVATQNPAPSTTPQVAMKRARPAPADIRSDGLRRYCQETQNAASATNVHSSSTATIPAWVHAKYLPGVMRRWSCKKHDPLAIA